MSTDSGSSCSGPPGRFHGWRSRRSRSNELGFDDFTVIGYDPYDPIKFEVAV